MKKRLFTLLLICCGMFAFSNMNAQLTNCWDLGNMDAWCNTQPEGGFDCEAWTTPDPKDPNKIKDFTCELEIPF